MFSEDQYMSLIGDIFDGYSEIELNGSILYLKHLSIKDQREINKFSEKFKAIAIKRGVPSKVDILAQLKEDNIWTDDDELKIQNLKSEISNLKITKKSIFLPSQKDAIQLEIDDRCKDLIILENQRADIIGTTAEDFANRRANEEFLRKLFFKDKSLNVLAFSDEEFSELGQENTNKLINEHKKNNALFADLTIQECVLQDCFSLYISQTDDLQKFYGKPVINLSVNQLKLGVYAKIFLNIFNNFDDIPDNIKDDPSALLRFAESKRSVQSGSNSKSRNADNGATAVFGATKEDLGFIDPKAKQISLSDELAKSGGSLNMEQMMAIMGQ